MVSQIERLREAAEAVRVRGDAGDRQQFVDTADGEDEPVVRQLTPLALRTGVADAPRLQVDMAGLAQDEPYVRQCAA